MDQKLFQSGMKMLLYIIKCSRSGIANVNIAEILEMQCKNLGLRIKSNRDKNEPCDIVCFSDSDYASDLDARTSVSGFVLYVLRVHVFWRSKAQKSMALSS